MNPKSREEYRNRCLELLGHCGLKLRADEISQFELADMALGQFEIEGLGLIVYINNDRYCAKELVMLPGQTCPQHRHPPVGADPGKMETFRCRWGKVFLYVEGPPSAKRNCKPPAGKGAYYTLTHEIELNPGEQYTIPPNTWHWFQAGSEGAVISEFSSTSRDELDIFADPGVRRMETTE
jgi:D-lyxose ketol-isomerase